MHDIESEMPSRHIEQSLECPAHPTWLHLVSQTDRTGSLWYTREDTNQLEASVEAGTVGPELTSQLAPAVSAAAVAQLHAASRANSADQFQVMIQPTLKLATPRHVGHQLS